jgi:transposase
VDWLIENLIVLDESGAHLAMANRYGRSPAGLRIRCPVPLNKGTRLSMIAAISASCVEAALYGEWATDTEIFNGFISEQLLPKLGPGKIVVMDNVAFHKNKAALEMIEATGAKVVFLPPYSPEFSPVENFWSKIKQSLRKSAARTLDEFRKAIRKAFLAVTPSDLCAWFNHCGYTPN